MKIDTAGNKIIEMIPNCDCGLTGGCKKCNPLLFEDMNKITIKAWIERHKTEADTPMKVELRALISASLKSKRYWMKG